MAQDTNINAVLQARDWEFLVGVIGFTTDSTIQDCINKLRNYYEQQVIKPSGNTDISIATTEGVLTSLYQLFTRVPTITSQTNNLQPYTRIRTAILALNNVADNYILNFITALESSGQEGYGSIRKTGRKFIMMKQFDNN